MSTIVRSMTKAQITKIVKAMIKPESTTHDHMSLELNDLIPLHNDRLAVARNLHGRHDVKMAKIQDTHLWVILDPGRRKGAERVAFMQDMRDVVCDVVAQKIVSLR